MPTPKNHAVHNIIAPKGFDAVISRQDLPDGATLITVAIVKKRPPRVRKSTLRGKPKGGDL
jgi:hypothetical protein